MKTYELKKGDKVKLDTHIITFIKMDGMYAKWENEDGEMETGNFEELEKVGEYYQPVDKTL